MHSAAGSSASERCLRHASFRRKAKQLAPRSVSSSEAYNLTAKDFQSRRLRARAPAGSVVGSDNGNGSMQEEVFYLPAGYRPASLDGIAFRP